jgi:hypoxanthine phosphoribosyltransferase
MKRATKQYHDHVRGVLLSEQQIQERVRQLAEDISRDYAGKSLTLVAVLKGSIVFVADLLRHLTIDCSIDFISVASYNGTESTGIVRLITDLRENPVGKDLLIVEDIVDTGSTLAYLRSNFLTRSPASVRVCALLDKADARKVPVDVEYRGFTIPDEFVVGYGLDYREQYRGLPYIGILDERKRGL